MSREAVAEVRAFLLMALAEAVILPLAVLARFVYCLLTFENWYLAFFDGVMWAMQGCVALLFIVKVMWAMSLHQRGLISLSRCSEGGCRRTTEA